MFFYFVLHCATTGEDALCLPRRADESISRGWQQNTAVKRERFQQQEVIEALTSSHSDTDVSDASSNCVHSCSKTITTRAQ